MFADPQPVQAEQRSERGVLPIDPLGSEQKPAELTAVQTTTLRRVDLGAADVLDRVGGDPSVDVREPVETADRPQPTVDRRRGKSSLFHVVAVQLDVRAGRGKHVERGPCSPGEVAAQVLAVRFEGATAVAGEERNSVKLRPVEHALV
jgi:hypothetical protein